MNYTVHEHLMSLTDSSTHGQVDDKLPGVEIDFDHTVTNEFTKIEVTCHTCGWHAALPAAQQRSDEGGQNNDGGDEDGTPSSNNNADGASALPAKGENKTTEGTVIGSDTTDWWFVTVPSGWETTIEAVPTLGNVDIAVYSEADALAGPTFNGRDELDISQLTGSSTDIVQWENDEREVANFYVWIKQIGSTDAEYTLEVYHHVGHSDVIESSNNEIFRDSAAGGARSTTQKGRVYTVTGDSSDWYAVTVPEEGEVTATLKGLTANADLIVYDQDQWSKFPIGFSFDSSTSTGTTNDSLVVTATEERTVVFEVLAIASSRIDYELELVTTNEGGPSNDGGSGGANDNDVPSDASDTGVARLVGNLADMTDETDWWLVSLEPYSIYEMRVISDVELKALFFTDTAALASPLGVADYTATATPTENAITYSLKNDTASAVDYYIRLEETAAEDTAYELFVIDARTTDSLTPLLDEGGASQDGGGGAPDNGTPTGASGVEEPLGDYAFVAWGGVSSTDTTDWWKATVADGDTLLFSLISSDFEGTAYLYTSASATSNPIGSETESVALEPTIDRFPGAVSLFNTDNTSGSNQTWYVKLSYAGSKESHYTLLTQWTATVSPATVTSTEGGLEDDGGVGAVPDNNTYDGASTLSSDSGNAGNIGNEDNTDWWVYSVPANKRVLFSLSGDDIDIEFKVYDDADATSGDLRTQTLPAYSQTHVDDATLDQTREYAVLNESSSSRDVYVRLTTNSADEDGYSITVTESFDDAPGDATHAGISFWSLQDANVSGAGLDDADWYFVSVSEDSLMHMELDATTGDIEYAVFEEAAALDSPIGDPLQSGTVLWGNDAELDIGGTSENERFYVRITPGAGEEGSVNYEIGLRIAGSEGGVSGDGGSSVNADNDEPEGASELSIDALALGTLSGTDEEDWWRVVVADGSTLNVSTRQQALNLDLYVFDRSMVDSNDYSSPVDSSTSSGLTGEVISVTTPGDRMQRITSV